MSGADKTEKPTPKRKRQARKEGRIARSPEVAAWASMLVATLIVPALLSTSSRSVREVWMHATRAIERPEPAVAVGVFREGMVSGLFAVLPLALALTVVGVAVNVAQVGFAPSGSLLKPKFKRINPALGLRRLLSPASVWEAGKSIIKLVLLSLLAWQALRSIVLDTTAGGGLSVTDMVGITARHAVRLVRNVALLGLLLAGVDYGLMKRRVDKGTRMSKQEVKDEHRLSEGDPFVRNAIRQRQLQMARRRMMADVPKADVVVVNPTHYAVALAYRPGRGAPRVVAKGAGAVALRIKSLAEDSRVPVVRDVPLARTLHRACDIGDEVPPELYEAVARLLAFIFSLPAADGQRGRSAS